MLYHESQNGIEGGHPTTICHQHAAAIVADREHNY